MHSDTAAHKRGDCFVATSVPPFVSEILWGSRVGEEKALDGRPNGSVTRTFGVGEEGQGLACHDAHSLPSEVPSPTPAFVPTSHSHSLLGVAEQSLGDQARAFQAPGARTLRLVFWAQSPYAWWAISACLAG